MLTARRRSTAVAAVATAAAIAAGTWVAVAVRPDDAPGRRDAADAVTAAVHLLRSDEPKHRVHITFRNTGAEPVRVGTVQLASPDFEASAPERFDYLLRPGGPAVDLGVAYGSGVCKGTVPTKAQPAQAAVTLATGDREPVAYRLPAPDPAGYLDRMLRQDCQLQQIAAMVDIELAGPWTQTTTDDGDEAVRASLDVRLKGSSTVTLTRTTGSVLFNLVTDDPITRVDPASPRSQPVVIFVNNRCDPHAVAEAESKQGYLFLIWVSIDAAEPIAWKVVPDEAGKSVLRQLISRGC